MVFQCVSSLVSNLINLNIEIMLDLHRNRWPEFRLRNSSASGVSSGSLDNGYLHLGQCVPPLLISTLHFLPACNQSSLKRNRSILLGMQTETRTLVISKSYPLRTDSAFISRYLGIEIAWFFKLWTYQMQLCTHIRDICTACGQFIVFLWS